MIKFSEEVLFEERQEGRQEGIHEREVEMAIDMLKDNEPIEKIIRYVRLDESTIIRLKTKLESHRDGGFGL